MTSLILNTDSYKLSHPVQYPPDATGMFSYFESRGGIFDMTVFFGLQPILEELKRPITQDDITEAAHVALFHGVPFYKEKWEYILKRYNGYLPVAIEAVPEGSIIATGNALFTVACYDPEVFWLVSHLETMLVRVWYPITVATLSYEIKKLILKYHKLTSDLDDEVVDYKLHDFGARGVSSLESAQIGGLAHLTSFCGTDNLQAILYGIKHYDSGVCGFSIPAAEHSAITSWGREGETEAYRNMLNQFAGLGKIVAVVSDSYDIYHAVEHIWGETLREEVINSQATIVIRPDSGHPPTVVLKVAELLAEKFGYRLNSQGYKVLNNVSIIQGDGIKLDSIGEILDVYTKAEFSTDSLNFGMGGGLLQEVNRDTCKFAMKCSAIRRGGIWHDVFKDPIDGGKQSKRGLLMTQRKLLENGRFEYRTINSQIQEETDSSWVDCLKPVYYLETGKPHLKKSRFLTIKNRIQQEL